MKLLAWLTILFLSSSLKAQNMDFFIAVDQFLGSSVENGLVDYESLKNNPTDLNNLVERISKFQIAGTLPAEQKAFYTNSYNILVIKQVVDNYPLESPLDLDGFFNKNKFKVAGRKLTLDELEKDILFSAFPDPRLHFVLVCAAVGCPPLASSAYTPDSIDVQIQRKTREILNINWYIRVYKSNAQISKVFDWYKNDFVNDSTTIKSFINEYREFKIPEGHELSIYEYDWSLNDIGSSFRY